MPWVFPECCLSLEERYPLKIRGAVDLGQIWGIAPALKTVYHCICFHFLV
jgi:hypothetical protein